MTVFTFMSYYNKSSADADVRFMTKLPIHVISKFDNMSSVLLGADAVFVTTVFVTAWFFVIIVICFE